MSSSVLEYPNAHFSYTSVSYNIVLTSHDGSAGASPSIKRGDLVHPRISHDLCLHFNEFTRAECERPSLPATRYLNIDDTVVYNTLQAVDAVKRSQLNSGASYIAIS